MRIAILNANSRPAGGVGSYLRIVMPALTRRGHDIAFWHELGEPPAGDPFSLPTGSPSWSVEQMGVDRALSGLHEWQPICSHGLLDRKSGETRLAPRCLLAHGYYGTCISGEDVQVRQHAMLTRSAGMSVHYYRGAVVGGVRSRWCEVSPPGSAFRAVVPVQAIVTLSESCSGNGASWSPNNVGQGRSGPGVSSATDVPDPNHTTNIMLFVGQMDRVREETT